MNRQYFSINRFLNISYYKEKPSLKTFLCLIAVIILILLVTFFAYPYDYNVDSYFYLEMAKGHFNNVVKPFSNRILHPFISGFLTEVIGIKPSISFITIQIISLIVFLTSMFMIQKNRVQNPILVILVIFCPFLITMFQQYYISDLFYTALLLLFFYSLIHHKIWLSFILVFLLQITRESTLLLILIISVVSIYHKNRKLLTGSIVCGIIGMVVVSVISGTGSDNIHHTSNFMYSFAKIIYNSLKNLFGIVLWTNTLAANNPGLFTHIPAVLVGVPDWFPLGSIRSIGIYELNLQFPLTTLLNMLTVFGALPLMFFSVVFRYPKYLSKKSPVYIQVAVWYGLLSYLTGPLVGSSVDRLIGYGWPVFWIVTPMMIKTFFNPNLRFYIRLFAFHFLLYWLPFLLLKFCFNLSVSSLSAMLIVSVLLQFFVYREIRKNMIFKGNESLII
jgi:hypothetical protein